MLNLSKSSGGSSLENVLITSKLVKEGCIIHSHTNQAEISLSSLCLISAMDPQPGYPLLTTFFFFCILAILTILKRLNSSRLTSKLPPGPWKLPLIGNIHNLVGSLPHRSLRDLASKHGPLMHLQLGEVSAVIVSSAEVAREVMKTHDINFAARSPLLASKILFYNSTDITFMPYGEQWKQLRKICSLELLSMNRVKSFRQIREEEMSNLVERLASSAGSPVNLTECIMSLAFTIVARTAFGKKCSRQEQFIPLVAEAVRRLSGFDINDVFPSLTWLHVISRVKLKLEKIHHEMDGILETIIREHWESRAIKTGEGDTSLDLIDVLLKFEEHDEDGFFLSRTNIKAVVLDIFTGGSETSATTVNWAMAEMMKRPKILARAQAEVRRVFGGQGRVVEQDLPELKFMTSIIKETLRLHPPGPLIPRECQGRCKIDRFEIPEKTRVIVNAFAIGRDPKYWTDPEAFDPERFLESHVDYKGCNFEYIPFGAGRRICPGMAYGLANVGLQLAMLLYHFNWKLPNGMKNEDLDMTESFGLSVRRKDDLILIPTSYHLH
ncbi:hypothetical protein SAY86_006870 [Trapa natans]|uniref:Cytochrome p450 n=1 Tax=Trapa natans TaxID=22666 RepID=A0AAN7QUM2_TRANT|nr:hypothetical protein SAY86_006870 [Trapa natans]